MKKWLFLMVLLIVASVVLGKVNFASTQMTPAAEREFMLNKLAEFSKSSGIDVEFLNFEYPQLFSRLQAEVRAGKTTLNLVADLQGNLYIMASEGLLSDLKDLKFEGKTFIETLERFAYVNGQKIFIPWLQATYVMAVNKKAFDYLPRGLSKEDVIKGTEKWTYDALLAWAKNIYEKTGQPLLGFPVGPKGLWHRFLHGYIYPSYTGAQALKFDSVRAVEMWNYLKELFKYVHPASTTWDGMADPLLREEVWIAWDHTARLKPAIVEKPDDFVVVPVPRGPMGRGYIIVLVGLAIPKGADFDEPSKVIDFLTSPEMQVEILKNVGFFPVVQEAAGAIPEGALKVLAQGVINQSAAKDSIISFIPSLGPKSGEFTETYRMAFTRIVFQGEDPAKVVKELGERIRQMFKETGAELPEPDASLF
ncbi:ABC transporter substrate-binding protein [Thermotoga sp. KOL6]|uniref:ABC transporter substrate-binding protein n=1 Tax=Thermotoga sp. KOL6 TaxID=126741 RepID=UPI000CBACDB5|nr:ABC transporter substrate-binding protein [Thermotoga sp. KOL6]PLV59954.1 ABC transporter substrate-binding protein [Thermotoga sp. KOL6]